MGSWHNYGKIWNIGHAAVTDIFDHLLSVQEKVDGSQFSFGLFDGVLYCKSKSAMLDTSAPDGMFAVGVSEVSKLDLHPGWTYRGEYLQKPKHNSLAYDRVPLHNVVLFDIATDEECYLPYYRLAIEAERLGLEVVPEVAYAKFSSAEDVLALLERTSFLGGQTIEGVVLKAYGVFGKDGKTLMAKYVRDEFRELNKHDFKVRNPGQNDIVSTLVDRYKTSARWDKAIIHLKENGKLKNEPADIGPLMKELHLDFISECKNDAQEELFKWAWPKVSRQLVSGFADYYKEKLLKGAFNE